MQQCRSLKFSSGEQTFSICLRKSCPYWNPKRFAALRPHFSLTPKATGQWLSSHNRRCCTEALLLFWGVASNFTLSLAGLDNHILFNSLETLSDDTKSATHSQWIVWSWEHGGWASRQVSCCSLFPPERHEPISTAHSKNRWCLGQSCSFYWNVPLSWGGFLSDNTSNEGW